LRRIAELYALDVGNGLVYRRIRLLCFNDSRKVINLPERRISGAPILRPILPNRLCFFP
jgi:hypothetical protein